MGYYVRIKSGKIFMPKETHAKILERWKLINQPQFDHLKRGGSFSNGSKTESWYSWMSADYDKEVTCVEDVLERLGFDFEVSSEAEAGIYVTGYVSKMGQEDLFFSAIHKWIKGSLLWLGEDGDMYSWVFPDNNYDPNYDDTSKIEQSIQTRQLSIS